MDILRDYINKKKKEKLVISTFFKNERGNIELYCNNLQPNNISLNLKDYWVIQINEFVKTNPNIKVIKDYYLVNFVDFEIARKNHLLSEKIKLDVLETRAVIVDSLLNNNAEKEDIFPLSSASIFKRLEAERKQLNYEREIHRVELLYYHVIDFSTTKPSSAVHKVLTKDERKRYQNDYKSHLNIHTDISVLVKDYIEDVGTINLKDALKKAKIAIRNSNDDDTKTKKKLLKICKLYRNMLEMDGRNKFDCYLYENEYTHQFIYPALKEVLYDCQVVFRLGEAHLQCAAASNNDDERTQSGPKIDIIILHKVHEFAISICEVSGPNHKTNKNHFLGDRNKLAKNMRAMLNHIEKSCTTPNATAFKKIKLYSFQVYLNTLYIYTLTPVGYGYSAFLLEKSISIPVSMSLLKNQLPVFLGWLWNLNTFFKEMITDINTFIELSQESEVLEIDSQPSSTSSSQESNQNKRQRRN